AVEIGEQNPAGMGEAVWALVKLADRREQDGDFAGAVGHLIRAIDAAEGDLAPRLTARAVELALSRVQDPRLAADAWERLLELHRRIGDLDVLARKLREAIECAFDAEWRAQLRMERARLLFDSGPD